jgi:hypothetical protein
MSKISFRPRGGQEGIEVTKAELKETAQFFNSQYLDMFIPLPDTTLDNQKCLLETCDERDEHGNARYWETETGSHGWCCSICGSVVQWG